MVSGKRTGTRQGLIILSAILYLFVGADPGHGGFFWGPDTVVTINGEKFSTKDVKVWWENWQEDEAPFPDTAAPFVNWQLLAAEAEKMGLYQEPSFRHKMRVFLNVRSLLQYKYDQINSRIEITDDMLRRHYREKYLPRFELEVLYFNDREKAEEAAALVREDNSTLRDYAESRPEELGKDFYFEQRSTRLLQLKREWRSAAEKLSPGEIAAPFAWREGFVVMELKARKGASPEDFQKMRQRMTEELRKEMEDRLTADLVRELKDRYEVSVDRSLFKQIDPDGGNEEILDNTLISMGGEEYSVQTYLDKLESQKKMQQQYGMKIEEPEAFKQRVLNGIISQTLISRASLDENYQEKEPLRPIYQFYRKHRLIRELEKRLFRPEASVTDEEIREYYQDNIGRFSRPKTVSIALIQDEQKLVDKMYGEIIRGVPFFDVADKYYAEGVPEERIQFSRLDPRVKNILDNLATGEVSQPFDLHGRHAFLKLVNRTPAEPMPLKHVKKKIVSILRDEKFASVRQDFLANLKSRSEITVNERVWDRLKKEIGNINAEQEN